MNHHYPTLVCAIAILTSSGSSLATPHVETSVSEVFLTTDKGVKAIDHFPAPLRPAPDTASSLAIESTLAVAPLAETFTLHSNSSASKVIYLDFDGHSGFEADYPPFNFEGPAGTFSDAELARIQLVWQSISEDFLPFDVDVTTEEPPVEDLRNTGGSDTRWGIRCVVAPGPWDYSWAYVGSFNWDTDYECQAYTGDNSWIWIADSASHEAGHALGLSHDGGGGDGEYYEGHGSGLTYWSPIMGWTRQTEPYGVSQWSIGEYEGADNTEDDLAIITSQNGFGYRPDDHGSTTATADPITLGVGQLEFAAEGIVERNSDVDYFAFTLPAAGDVQFLVTPDPLAANLDVLARLHDESGGVIFSSNPTDSLHARIDVSLSAGDYYVSVTGTGFGSPPSDGYSDYGSLGYYSVAAMGGTVTNVEMGHHGSAPSTLHFVRKPATPFASSSSFSFALPASGRVRAWVFDVNGRLVTALLDHTFPAGEHRVSWQPRSHGDPAPGLYLIRIEAGGESITAKATYLR